jgi:hypothetical protein
MGTDNAFHGQGAYTYANGDKYLDEFRNRKLQKVSNKRSRSTLNCVFDRNYPDPFLAGQTGTLTIDRGRGLLTLQYSRKAQARMAIWKKIQVHHDNIVGTETLTRDGSEFVINRYTGSANYHRGRMKKIYLSNPNKYSKAKSLMNLKMVCSTENKNRIL